MKSDLKKLWWLISGSSIVIAITALLANPKINQLDGMVALFMAIVACPLIPTKEKIRAVSVLSLCVCNFLLLLENLIT